MRGKLHLLINALIFVVLGFLIYLYLFTTKLLLIAVYLGIVFGNIPDMDLTVGQKYHRHFLFHSIIWTCFLWFLSIGFPDLQLIISFMILGVGLHCLEDIQVFRVSMRGAYTIKIRQTITGKVKGLSGIGSTFWLLLNFVISLLFFTLTLYLWWL